MILSVRPAALACLSLLALPWGVGAANVPPQVTANIADATLFAGAPADVIELANFFTDPDTSGVRLATDLGTVNVALYKQATPLTVANFLNYVDSGRYSITDPTTLAPAPIFFHRSVTDFVVQTGGFLATSSPGDAAILRPTAVTAFAPVKNEPGLSNLRGTLAMAKLSNAADSATSQWFINLADNSATLDAQNGGFTVFGKVLGNGMTVVDAIAALPKFNFGATFDTVPLRNYTQADFDAGTPASPANSVAIPRITRTAPLTFTAVSNNPALASVSISGTHLLVAPKAPGFATITVTATDVDGASIAQTFQVTMIDYPARLANLSTRVVVGQNDDALIGGFIILGDAPKRVAIRALGPGLTSRGVANVLADPTLELHAGSGALLATNDNWQDAPNEQEIIDAGLAPTKAKESVILMTLPATSNGSGYTAVIRGAGGNGLVEVYDLDSGPGSAILNISTRGNVQTGNNVMIGGFIVLGNGSQRVLVRAVGPSLAGAGISNPLSDPTLSLVNAQGVVIDANNDWMDSPHKAEIQASMVAPTDLKESAVVQTLAAGNYTAIVRGAGTATGTALVEVYALPAN
ncbi:MAG: peptidylprolyl isomerase [Chthoniobacterales bacterium]